MYEVFVHMFSIMYLFMYDKNVMLRGEVGFDGYIKSSASRNLIWQNGGMAEMAEMTEWQNGRMAEWAIKTLFYVHKKHNTQIISHEFSS